MELTVYIIDGEHRIWASHVWGGVGWGGGGPFYGCSATHGLQPRSCGLDLRIAGVGRFLDVAKLMAYILDIEHRIWASHGVGRFLDVAKLMGYILAVERRSWASHGRVVFWM